MDLFRADDGKFSKLCKYSVEHHFKLSKMLKNDTASITLFNSKDYIQSMLATTSGVAIVLNFFVAISLN